jgi:hypothetical protein
MFAPKSITAASPEAVERSDGAQAFWSPEAADARAALRVERLQAMAGLGLDLVEDLHRLILSGDAGPQAGTAFIGLSRAVRQTVALEARLDIDAEARAAEQDRRATAAEGADLARQRRDQAREIVEAAIEAAVDPERDPARAEWLYDCLHERLEDADDTASQADRPLGLVVAEICRALDLEPDWALWADEDWAIAEALERPPGSPFLAVRSGSDACAGDYRAMLRPSWAAQQDARAPP